MEILGMNHTPAATRVVAMMPPQIALPAHCLLKEVSTLKQSAEAGYIPRITGIVHVLHILPQTLLLFLPHQHLLRGGE